VDVIFTYGLRVHKASMIHMTHAIADNG
jgi:hypothetical protein